MILNVFPVRLLSPCGETSEHITRAAAAFRIADQHALLKQLVDVTQPRVVRTLREFAVIRGSEVALQTVEHSVQNKPLAVIQIDARQCFPESRLLHDFAERDPCVLDRAAQTCQKPFELRPHIHIALLCRLKDLVISGALLLDLCRHAVEALWAVLGARKCHVGNGTRDTAIAAIKWMDVTNHRWAIADFRMASMAVTVLNQSIKARNSRSSRGAAGASKRMCSRPIGPETTCIGPVLSPRHAPT